MEGGVDGQVVHAGQQAGHRLLFASVHRVGAVKLLLLLTLLLQLLPPTESLLDQLLFGAMDVSLHPQTVLLLF